MARKKKKVSKKKAVAKKKSTAVVSWKQELAKLAEQESDRATTIGGGGDTIRLTKGGFKFQGEDLGEAIKVIVVDFCRRKNYFDRPFDEDNPSPPACFAVSADGKNMEPHEDSPDPQDDICQGCWANEFKSDNRGKGKACRDSYQLAIIAENQLGEKEPDVAYINVPPTSIQAWDSYMVKRNKVMKLPALAFVTEISYDEDSEYQKLLFDEAGRVDDDYFGALFKIKNTVHEIIMQPVDVTNYEPPGAAKKKKKKKKKKVTKKKAKKKAKKKSRYA
jgi:hypothetical protein